MPPHERIDTHAHFIPSFYRDACEETGHGKPDGMPAVPPWTEEAHLELMKDLNITKSILSISSPGVFLKAGDNKYARKLARQCNDYSSDLVRRRPEQFGFWAVLPLPDVDGALEEIAYSLDTLKADGIILESNHHGTYLGDKAFDPIFAELNRRKATIFIHPTSPSIKTSCCGQHTAVTMLPQYPNPMFEFMFDTARMLINLFMSQTIKRCPDITFVIPHAGAVTVPLIQRFCGFSTLLGSDVEISAQITKETFARQFYFDLAGFPFPDQVLALLRYSGPDRLLYGSDYPFTPARVCEGMVHTMTKGMEDIFPDEAEREKIYVNNAKRLLKISK